MGFLSRIGKGIKSAFKKIGKGIKSAAKFVGRAVDKLGIVGQIGLMFFAPGIGGALAKGLGSVTSGLLGSSNILAQGLGHVLATAGKFATTAGNVFSTISEGVTSFAKNIGGKVLENLGLKKQATDQTLSEAFQATVDDIVTRASAITDPFSMSNVEFAASLGGNATNIKVDDNVDDSLLDPNASNAAETVTPKGAASTVETVTPKGPDFHSAVSNATSETFKEHQDGLNNMNVFKDLDIGKHIRDTLTDIPNKVGEAVGNQVANAAINAIVPQPEIQRPSRPGQAHFSYVQGVDRAYQSQGLAFGGTATNVSEAILGPFRGQGQSVWEQNLSNGLRFI